MSDSESSWLTPEQSTLSLKVGGGQGLRRSGRLQADALASKVTYSGRGSAITTIDGEHSCFRRVEFKSCLVPSTHATLWSI